MRYQKGSLNLYNFRDKALLDFVADSRFATHSQLFEFARVEYHEWNRPVFNWRIRRMVEGGLVRKRSLPMLSGDALYSITRAGVQALERLGTYYLGGNLEWRQDAHEFQVPHALEVNNIRLVLLRTGLLRGWIPETFIRVMNLSPANAYAKVYDAIARVALNGNLVEFAIEYERSLKSPAKYKKIRDAIELEKQVKAFLYLVPSWELLWCLLRAFSGTKQLVMCGLIGEFKKEHFETGVYANYIRSPLQKALLGLAAAK